VTGIVPVPLAVFASDRFDLPVDVPLDVAEEGHEVDSGAGRQGCGFGYRKQEFLIDVSDRARPRSIFSINL
jgi:hypothetical protein